MYHDRVKPTLVCVLQFYNLTLYNIKMKSSLQDIDIIHLHVFLNYFQMRHRVAKAGWVTAVNAIRSNQIQVFLKTTVWNKVVTWHPQYLTKIRISC